MKVKDIIRYTWEMERKYNNGKTFTFFQDLSKAIFKELEECENTGAYYGYTDNLRELRNIINS